MHQIGLLICNKINITTEYMHAGMTILHLLAMFIVKKLGDLIINTED